MKKLLGGLSSLYGAVARLNNSLYDRGSRSVTKVAVPVISVGNLTVGGTGKTPVTSFCLSLLASKGHRPGLVVRSYRTSRREPGRVDLSVSSPESDFGDEAVWYAKTHPSIPVWSGPRKVETAQEMLKHEQVDVLLVDDGFQHRALHRDLDLVLLDSTDSEEAYRPLPLGRARESWAGLGRAQGILWTKCNLGQAPNLVLPVGKPVFHFESFLEAKSLAGKALLVSAIARPESFEALVRASSPGLAFDTMIFRDHHPYQAGDVRQILSRAESFGADIVLTTEKDEVKLRPLWKDSSQPLLALPLEVRLRESVESFYEFLRQSLRERA
ncbi:MAG: tetraacyldisaccharide 4'-kinase [Bdellovibrionaceae bacterium]|nr:tetraacyldisaccharide 4'-kinase [Pseudobdellovibrionaceae bacterium]